MDLSQFNASQKEAITLPIATEEIKDILIVAGAGSGKTRVLINRIAFLLENEVMPSEILGMTFTKKAANEMQSRLNAVFNQRVPVKLSTFHALSADLLRTYLPTDFMIIDDTDQTRLLRKVIKLAKSNSSESVSLKDFKLWLSVQRNQCLDPKEPSPYDSELITHYRRLASMYESMKNSLGGGAFDFDDLLEKACELVGANPSIQKSIHNRWRYILVDEYQDTNKRQFQLLHALRGPDTQLLQVGDEDQLIYSWRGADINHILSTYEESKNGGKVYCVFLSDNYRCTGNILSVGNAVVSENKLRTGKSLVAFKESGLPVELCQVADCTTEAYDIARNLRRWNEEDGIDYNDMAVLMRVNRMSRPIERALIEFSIPYQLHNGVALFDSPEARVAMALLWLTELPNETFYIEQVFDLIKIGVGPAKLSKMDAERIKAGDTWFSYLKKSSLSSRPVVKDLLDSYELAKDALDEGDLAQALTIYFHRLNFLQFFKEEEQERRSVTIDVLSGVLDDYERHAKLRMVKPTVSDFQEQRLLNDSLTDKDETDKVHLMSIHKSKGLEFRCGALVGLQDGVFPRNPAEADMEEERRLAYVAITRFMDSLMITQSHYRLGFQDAIPYSSILNEPLSDLKKDGAIIVARD